MLCFTYLFLYCWKKLNSRILFPSLQNERALIAKKYMKFEIPLLMFYHLFYHNRSHFINSSYHHRTIKMEIALYLFASGHQVWLDFSTHIPHHLCWLNPNLLKPLHPKHLFLNPNFQVYTQSIMYRRIFMEADD